MTATNASTVEKNPDAAVTAAPAGYWGTRFTYVVMATLGLALNFACRVDLSVAIIPMVNRTTDNAEDSMMGEQCAANAGGNDNNAADGGGGDFNWDESQQGLVLGGFSFGYFSTLLLGGILAERLNAKWVFGLGVFFTSVPALLAPLIAGVHVNLFIALRAFQGAAQGPTLPAMYVMSAKWLPLPEKTRLFTVIMTGLHFGTILGFPISGTIAHNLGWRGIFYTFGSCGIVWFALWIFLVYESPAMHPRISAAEREYIEANTPKQTMATKRLPPLLKVMTTPSFLALIVAYMGYNWGLHTMMTSGPIYMSTILHLSTADVGYYSSFPYIATVLCSFPVSFIGDKLINSGKYRLVMVRKVFSVIAGVGPAAALIWLGFTGCNVFMAVAALCTAMGLSAGAYAGFMSNFSDLSPNYSGFLLGITLTCSNISGFVSPMVTSAITGGGNPTLEAWQVIFLICAVLYGASAVVYAAFGSASVQEWDSQAGRKGETNLAFVEPV